MKQNRFARVAAVAAVTSVLFLAIIAAGCASRDQRLANNGFSAIEGGRYADAERMLTEAVQLNPDNPYALLNLGAVYQRTGRFNQAREMFDKVIALDALQNPARRSKFVDPSKNLKQIAEDNLKTLPPQQKDASLHTRCPVAYSPPRRS